MPRIDKFKLTEVAVEGYHIVEDNKILTIPYTENKDTNLCTLYVSRDFLEGLILLFNHSLSNPL